VIDGRDELARGYLLTLPLRKAGKILRRYYSANKQGSLCLPFLASVGRKSAPAEICEVVTGLLFPSPPFLKRREATGSVATFWLKYSSACPADRRKFLGRNGDLNFPTSKTTETRSPYLREGGFPLFLFFIFEEREREGRRTILLLYY